MIHFIPPDQRKIALLAARAETLPVLLIGPIGSGRSALARWIHNVSPRCGDPYVALEASPEDQLHYWSSRWIDAAGGTLYLSDVYLWPKDQQAALALAIKRHSVPGKDQTYRLLKARVIISVHSEQDLFELDEGLREAISFFKIRMPALRERAADFRDVVQILAKEIAREIGREQILGIAPEAMPRLLAYHWPGNLRELRNVLRVAVFAAKGPYVQHEEFPEGFDRAEADFDPETSTSPFHASREQFERVYWIELLKTARGRIGLTSALARTPENTVKTRLRLLGIDPTQYEAPSA